MKNVLPISLFIVLLSLKLLPGVFRWVPDILIGVIAVIVISRVTINRSMKIPVVYLFVFSLFLLVVISGVILNQVSPDVIFAGVRTYFKYIPVFLLGMVYDYTKDDLKKQFIVLIVIGLLQVPLVFWQRFVQYRYTYSGDAITGSLNSSNSLSIMMIALVFMLIALFLQKHITFKTTFVLSFLLFLPTTLNETKVTPIFFVVGMVSLIFILRKNLSTKQIGIVMSGGFLFLIIFVSFYDKLYQRDVGYIDLLSDKERMIDNYNLKGYEADANAVFDRDKIIVGEIKLPERSELGRLDSILIPLNVLTDKGIPQLMFGLGIGNVISEFGKGGQYDYIKKPLFAGSTTITQLLWETGLLGACLFSIFVFLIGLDSLYLSKQTDIWGALAAGWFSITTIILFSLPYNTIFHINEIAILFFYYSGIVVFRNAQIKSKVIDPVNNSM